MKEPHDFMYGFKSQFASINERLSKLEGFLHSRRNNKSKIFSPLGNELLPPSKNITLKNYHIMYTMKQKDLYDYDPRCIMSNGLMFYEIIMAIIRNNEFSHPTDENACLLHRLKTTPFICTGVHFKILLGERNLRVFRNSMCTITFFKE